MKDKYLILRLKEIDGKVYVERDFHQQVFRKKQDEINNLVDLLKLILPMAKGYAYKNDVGSNMEYIQKVEKSLKEYTGIFDK